MGSYDNISDGAEQGAVSLRGLFIPQVDADDSERPLCDHKALA